MATGITTTPSSIIHNATATATVINSAGSGTGGSYTDNQYFYEDEVFRIDKKGRIKFGVVLENSGSFSSDDEDYFDDILYKGEVRVAWHPDGKEEVLSERMVGLADRTLMPGDVVRRLVPGKDTQRGYCREINMKADAKIIGTKYVVKNVMAERLKPLVKMPRDNAVCLDSWVGSTKCVEEKVVLKSSCGATFEVNDSELYQLKDANSKLRNGLFADTVFYPGQTVTARIELVDPFKMGTPSLALKTKKGKPIARKFIVQSVQIEGVWVHWQCKALSEDNCDIKSALQQPTAYVTGDDLKRLKRLNLFESCMLQINDKNYLKITDCDVIVRKSQWKKEQAIKYKLLWSQKQKDQKDDNKQIRNTKCLSSKFEKIKIKLSTTATVTNQQQQQDSEKKLSNSKSSKYNAIRLESHNSNTNSNNKERNETEKKNEIDKNMKINNDNTDNTADDWQTEEDDEDENGISQAESTTTVSTCSSPTPRSSPKRSPLTRKKQVKRLKKSITSTAKMPEIGDEVVTEALVVYSTATVVWQDGTIETGIPSTQLYPIHHLDDHEFFPGDFVLSSSENTDVSYRDYGVIQTVDHQGRTAHVKWFTAYTSADEPRRPTYTGQSEVSVYDLKDHPDFQYRPGTIVIRIANFIGEDAPCTAGQIIDNYTDGRVKVWWVDGHISMCWPQDLFEVGQYEPENNFFGNNDSDNDSWETESITSELGGTATTQKLVSEPQISANLERARVAIARLEEIFIINPNLQNHEVMRKLLAVYKTCRYLDRLMNTSFFHEDHFMGLLERVRKGGNQSKAERAQDQKNRLFNQSSPNPKANNTVVSNTINSNVDTTKETKEYCPKMILCSSTPCKTPIKRKSSKTDILSSQQQQESTANNSTTTIISSNKLINNSNSDLIDTCDATATTKCSSKIFQSNNLDKKMTVIGYEDHLLSCVMSNIEKATQETKDLKKLNAITVTTNNDKENNKITQKNLIIKSNDGINNTSYDNDLINVYSGHDSENYSRNEYGGDGSSTSYVSSNNDLTADNNLLNNSSSTSLLLKPNDIKSISSSSIVLTDDRPELVCAKLCALLKTQLVKALQEIQVKYCKENLNLSEVIEYDDDNDDNTPQEIRLEDCSIAIAICDDENESITEIKTATTTPIKSTMSSITNIPDTPIKDESDSNVTALVTAAIQAVPSECFQVLETAPSSHKFLLAIFHPSNTQQYYKAIRREHKLLRSSLPPGVWVRVFEDRMDLVSVMIQGPKNTPYEDGMFFFDIQLGREYPKMPPLCHYISYCADRLNPNLYEDGKVCVSLLGTWTGKESEIWGSNSTLLQVIVSIQGLILVSEPYFNEAGYEKQRNTQQGKENSRMYNEMVIIKLVQSMTKLLSSPSEIFHDEIVQHFKERGKAMYDRIKGWMEMSQTCLEENDKKDKKATLNKNENSIMPPEFPLVPASRGFCLTLSGLLDSFYNKIELIIKE